MALAFFGYLFLGTGPAVVFFLSLLARKSFLVLLSIFSAFVWLVVLLVIGAIFRGFVPVDLTTGSYAGLLIATVLIEEAARYGVWIMHRKTLNTLDDMARQLNHSFSASDKMAVALAWGYGHGACHVVFLFLSILSLSTSDGTFYTETCPSMSLFLVLALLALAFSMILPALMVLALDGYQNQVKQQVVAAPLVHLAAALLTLLNLRSGGCLVSVPLLLATGLALVVGTTQLLIRRAGEGANQLQRLRGL